MTVTGDVVETLADLSRVVMQECEGHRFGQPGYDITLDHLYEMAAVARDVLGAYYAAAAEEAQP